MTTTSRRLSARGRVSRNSHTPGKDKGGYCVRSPDAAIACSTNPYKGLGLKGQVRARYNRWWGKMLPLNGINRKNEG